MTSTLNRSIVNGFLTAVLVGTLATAVGSGATNYILFVVENGTFEITGHQPIPGAGRVDFGALARGAGFSRVFRFEDADLFASSLPELLNTPGPTFIHVLVERGSEGPIGRRPEEDTRYLQVSLSDWSRVFRQALERG